MATAPVEDLQETDVSLRSGMSAKSGSSLRAATSPTARGRQVIDASLQSEGSVDAQASSETEGFLGADVPLGSVRAALVRAADRLMSSGRILSTRQAVQVLVEVEDISRIVDHLQVITAGMARDFDLASAEQRLGSSSLPSSTAQAPEGPAISAADIGAGSGATSGERPAQRCAQYLRAKLGISRAEAKRRLVLAQNVLPGTSVSGASLDPPLQTLSIAVGSGEVSGRAATIICAAVDRVRCVAVDEQLVQMERQLTLQAIESDEEVLRSVTRYWEAVLDQDGQEPTEKILRARQGVFLRGRRHGLHMLEIGATDEQFEHLATVMNTATNPRSPRDGRSGSGTRPDHDVYFAGNTTSAQDLAGSAANAGSGAGSGGSPSVYGGLEAGTRAQRMLDGLVGACRIALSGTQLPATGGHRPQVMVTIDYRDLLADLTTGSEGSAAGIGSVNSSVSAGSTASADNAGRTSGRAGAWPGAAAWSGSGAGIRSRPGRAVFAEQMSTRSIRRLACDAYIIPLVLGGDGQVLDLGRANRLFPPHLRRALVARDIGCAFPDCTVPASWCEAHHITPWAHGGNTSIDNGVLLCAHHHHTIHQGQWTVASRNGMPWFTPPPHLARHGTTARRNRYWNVRPDVLTASGTVST
ncbi:HNH endonuclease signature motif containing protein [Arthrobacter sp. MDT2-16]